MAEGVIYILTNQAMPGFIKIGRTEGDLASRIRGLNNSSVPFDFECFYAARVANCHETERLLHDAFADFRRNPRREFFELAPERARSAIKLAAIEDVTPNMEEVVPDQAERTAIGDMAMRRRRTSLADIGLDPGFILTLDRAEAITCQVEDEWQVLFRGQVMSPSRAALIALRELGYDWPRANGWAHWTYQGRSLSARVDEHLALSMSV